MRRIFSIAVFLLISCSLFAATSEEQRRSNLDSFDQVWNTVREKHWDPALGGVDWDAVRAELRPKVEKAQSEPEVRAILSDMLARLHLSHYGVIPGSVYQDVENNKASHAGVEAGVVENEAPFETGTAGIEIRVVDGDALVFQVEKEAPAFQDGVRPGWIVKRIDDEELAPVLRRVGATYETSTLSQLMLARTVMARLDGPLDNTIDVEFRDAKDRPVELSIRRKPFRGELEKFGFMPESWMWINRHSVAPGIGYIAFNYFLDPVKLTGAFQEEITSCAGCAGLVIDLRGNPGGIGILAMGLAGYFLHQQDLKLGTLYMRDLPMKFVINPRAPEFHGRVAILIDGLSASTSEIFAGGLQDLKRARIFGTQSAGAALPSMFERLPNGDGFQYAMATYRSANGKTLEGAGVTPDVVAPLTRAALLKGHDAPLEAAMQWIGSAGAQNQPVKGSTTQ